MHTSLFPPPQSPFHIPTEWLSFTFSSTKINHHNHRCTLGLRFRPHPHIKPDAHTQPTSQILEIQVRGEENELYSLHIISWPLFFEAPIFSSQPVTLPLLPIPFTTASPRRRSRLMILHSMGKCGDHVYLDHLQNKHHFYFFPSMSSYVCNLSQEKRLGMLSQVSVFFTRQVAHHTFFCFWNKMSLVLSKLSMKLALKKCHLKILFCIFFPNSPTPLVTPLSPLSFGVTFQPHVLIAIPLNSLKPAHTIIISSHYPRHW